MSETGGTKIDGTLTRNSFRVRTQQEQHKGDFILPHVYDKNKRQLGVNSEFVKLYPDKVSNYFTNQELRQAGYPKLANFKKPKKPEPKVKFSGSQKKGMERLLKWNY